MVEHCNQDTGHLMLPQMPCSPETGTHLTRHDTLSVPMGSTIDIQHTICIMCVHWHAHLLNHTVDDQRILQNVLAFVFFKMNSYSVDRYIKGIQYKYL